MKTQFPKKRVNAEEAACYQQGKPSASVNVPGRERERRHTSVCVFVQETPMNSDLWHVARTVPGGSEVTWQASEL